MTDSDTPEQTRKPTAPAKQESLLANLQNADNAEPGEKIGPAGLEKVPQAIEQGECQCDRWVLRRLYPCARVGHW